MPFAVTNGASAMTEGKAIVPLVHIEPAWQGEGEGEGLGRPPILVA